MTRWVVGGLRTGIKTTPYPSSSEATPGVSPGLPVGTRLAPDQADDLATRCPTGALVAGAHGVAVERARCVHCFRCVGDAPVTCNWEDGYEWAAVTDGAVEDAARRLHAAFGRSLHVRVVDGGDCGACLSEVRQLDSPYYNMHRLGIFLTPSPRHADVLLVVGPVTEHCRLPLAKAFDAMPTPKRVLAVGACALSGGVFGPSFTSGAGVADLLPVDVLVPGCPPPPLAILNGLLVLVGRKPPQRLRSEPPPAVESTR